MKKIFSIILTFVFLFMMSVTAFAADTTPEVTFNGNTELFSYKNVETAPNGNPKLFFGFEGAIPGDSFTQNIEFNTKNIKGKTVNIYLHSENPNEDYNEIMESAIFTVFYQGEEISSGTLAEGIKLGTFTDNGKRDFTVEFSIPLEVDNRIENLYGTIDWVFVAELMENDTDLPQTGDSNEDVTMFIVVLIISLIAIIGIIIYKKKKS